VAAGVEAVGLKALVNSGAVPACSLVLPGQSVERSRHLRKAVWCHAFWAPIFDGVKCSLKAALSVYVIKESFVLDQMPSRVR